MGRQQTAIPRSKIDQLETIQIQSLLRTTTMARTIFLFSRLGSTNRTAMKMAHSAKETMAEGTLVLADAQDRGRGRLGRSWISPAGGNLYASYILRPQIPASQTPIIACLAANAVAGAIRRLAPLKPAVKWPNDILIRERKVAGILAELQIVKQQANYLVLGIGINVNLDPARLRPTLRGSATSLLQEAGKSWNRNELIAALSLELENRYLCFLREGPATLMEEYRALCTTIGRRVRISFPGRMIEGNARGVTDDGALILRTDSGAREVIHSGEIVHLRYPVKANAARD